MATLIQQPNYTLAHSPEIYYKPLRYKCLPTMDMKFSHNSTCVTGPANLFLGDYVMCMLPRDCNAVHVGWLAQPCTITIFKQF